MIEKIIFLFLLIFNTLLCSAQTATYYWRDSIIKSRGDTLNGKKTGHWKEWYENGALWSTGSFSEGEKTGLWKYWYKDGNKWSELNMDSGLCVNWYSKGQLEKKGSVKGRV